MIRINAETVLARAVSAAPAMPQNRAIPIGVFNDVAGFEALHVSNDPSQVMSGGQTAITNAVEQGHTETLIRLLYAQDLQIQTVNQKKSNGESALFMAAKLGNVELVRALLNVPGIDMKASRIPGDGMNSQMIAQLGADNMFLSLEIRNRYWQISLLLHGRSI